MGQWLHLLSAPGADVSGRKRNAARRMLPKLVAYGKAHLLANMELLAAQHIDISDDGVSRMVTAARSVGYGYNRRDRCFFAAIREPDGSWRYVPATEENSVIFDTYLPLRAWRRRIRYSLRTELHVMLVGLVVQEHAHLTHAHLRALDDLCADIVDRAWIGLQMRKRLIRSFPTKRLRRQIRKAMEVDPDLMAMARAARFRTRVHAIDQKWLTFVWQHQEELSRIRSQTPALLRTVAEHMFQHGTPAGADPTRSAVKTLIALGVTKRSYLLLAKRSDRPFREVLRRCLSDQALDGMALALALTESGHDAAFPRPLFCRVTMAEFGATMTISRIRERLSVVPRCVFTKARARMAQARDGEDLLQVALAYRTIVDWFVTCQPEGYARAGWFRWLALAHEAEERRQITPEPTTWPCAVEELRTPEAEVLALATPLALFEEGRALRHCVYRYVAKCRNDQARLFSARMWHQGRIERATIGLWKERWGWRIWDVRGPCNLRMGGHWIPLARQVAEAYTRNAESGQLLLPIPSAFDKEWRHR